MIRREHIKQAVDAISRRDPEIGYSLDEMLGMGLIDAPDSEEPDEDETLHFLFEGRKVLVNRVLFFQEGTAPIEQELLIRYGELVRRQEIQERGGAVDYTAVLREIHEEGLRLAVRHEIDYALTRLRSGGRAPVREREAEAPKSGIIDLLEKIKREDGSLLPGVESPGPGILYEGRVDEVTPALFTSFPLTMNALMQVADMNLEFFHVRFVLNCLVRGVERNLFACLIGNRIAGLVFLTLRERFLQRDLEIKYIATLRRDQAASSFNPPKGVGTFLVAGVWMLLKNEMEGSAGLILDAEVQARRFYESAGFESRGFSGFVLRRPRAYLHRAILSMAFRCPNLRKKAVEEIAGMIRKQVKDLRKKPRNEAALSERNVSLASIRECLGPLSRLEFRAAARESLVKYRRNIAESEELLRSMADPESDARKVHVHAAGTSH